MQTSTEKLSSECRNKTFNSTYATINGKVSGTRRLLLLLLHSTSASNLSLRKHYAFIAFGDFFLLLETMCVMNSSNVISPSCLHPRSTNIYVTKYNVRLLRFKVYIIIYIQCSKWNIFSSIRFYFVEQLCIRIIIMCSSNDFYSKNIGLTALTFLN